MVKKFPLNGKKKRAIGGNLNANIKKSFNYKSIIELKVVGFENRKETLQKIAENIKLIKEFENNSSIKVDIRSIPRANSILIRVYSTASNLDSVNRNIDKFISFMNGDVLFEGTLVKKFVLTSKYSNGDR